MKFVTLTTEDAMSKMAAFIAYAPAQKLTYFRNRSLFVLGEDLSDTPDETLLKELEPLELRMQLYIDQFEKVKGTLTPGLTLDSDLVEKTNAFINVAALAGIEFVLRVLQAGGKTLNCTEKKMNTVIDTLFGDRHYLQEQLEHIRSSIKKPDLVCEVIRTDLSTYDEVYFPVIDQFVKGLDLPFALAFPSLMGIESCMLIHPFGMRVHEGYEPRVSGFSNEFFMYLILHELAHLLCYAKDTASVLSGKLSVGEFDVYSLDSLSGPNTHNADSYAVLILNAVALLHKEGCVDLRNY